MRFIYVLVEHNVSLEIYKLVDDVVGYILLSPILHLAVLEKMNMPNTVRKAGGRLIKNNLISNKIFMNLLITFHFNFLPISPSHLIFFWFLLNRCQRCFFNLTRSPNHLPTQDEH